MTTLIQTAIQHYGARAVYAAANAKMSGDGTKLAAMGLDTKTMGDVYAIQSEAYKQLGDADKAIDHADVSARLTQIK